MLKKLFLSAVLLLGVAILAKAQGGADYGRGAETDPVASALVGTVSGRVTAVESKTNAWNGAVTAANDLTGRVATVEGKTNAWNGAVSSANDLTGRVATVEGKTNAWNGAVSSANDLTGRVASVEGQTNAWNIAAANAADWTNHVGAMVAAVTNVLISADSKTNTIVVERGSIKSWTVEE